MDSAENQDMKFLIIDTDEFEKYFTSKGGCDPSEVIVFDSFALPAQRLMDDFVVIEPCEPHIEYVGHPDQLPPMRKIPKQQPIQHKMLNGPRPRREWFNRRY